MKTLKELMAQRAKILEDLRAILDAADAEKRDITDEEEARYNDLEVELKSADEAIEAEQKRQSRKDELTRREAEIKKPVNQPPRMAATYRAEDPDEFKSFGEFFAMCVINPQDRRLADLYESRAQSMGVGAKGGFLIPTQFRENLLSVTPQEAIFRPRCTVIPAGDPPDSEISMPALDQGSSQNMYGGITMQWVAEGGPKPETDLNLREVTWKPHEIAGYVIVTDKLLRNYTAMSALIEKQFRLAKIGVEDDVFFKGDGIGKPLGVIYSPARIDYARAAANAISYADVTGMLARVRRQGMNAGWVTSQTTIPQLTAIADAASRNIWVESAAAGMPPTLMGIPVYFSERAPALGSTGDLSLVDMSYYYIKDGSGPYIAASEHVYFTSNKTVIKFFWNVDGHSWLQEPIPLEGSTSNTVSPFIILN